MSGTTPTKTIQVVLPVQKKTNIDTFDVEMQHIHDLLQGNPDYPTLQGDLPQFQADITLLETDETHVLSHLTGAVGALNAQKKVVYNTADGFRGIVQTVVNKPVNIANAVAMVAGAGMLIKGKIFKNWRCSFVKYKDVVVLYQNDMVQLVLAIFLIVRVLFCLICRI